MPRSMGSGRFSRAWYGNASWSQWRPTTRFFEVLDADAQRACTALRLVLAQPGISSQVIDNLNGIHSFGCGLDWPVPHRRDLATASLGGDPRRLGGRPRTPTPRHVVQVVVRQVSRPGLARRHERVAAVRPRVPRNPGGSSCRQPKQPAGLLDSRNSTRPRRSTQTSSARCVLRIGRIPPLPTAITSLSSVPVQLGLIAASFAAGAGARVALVERNLMGGDCLNVGCVPSKSIIRSSRVFAELRDAAALGWRVPPGAEADFGAVMERMRGIRARISPHDSAVRYRDEKGIDVFLGPARFTGESTLDVDGTSLRFKKAVIATGARAAQLPIPGLAECGALTNETVFNLTHRPRRLAVIGAGPIGAELAQAFCRLGCEVTLVEVMDHILGREDPDAAAMVQAALARDGVRLRLACQIERIECEGDEKVVHIAGAGTDALVVDEVLVGVGRTPNVDNLGLDAAEVNHDVRGVTVDDALQTSNPRIYAAGDVCMAWKFTHAAEDAARVAVQNALFPGRRRLSTLTMPWCTYTDPEIAHVGLYEHQAVSQGVAVSTYTQHWGDVGPSHHRRRRRRVCANPHQDR